MSTADGIKVNNNGKKDLISTLNKKVFREKISRNGNEIIEIENIEARHSKCIKPIYIFLIILGCILVIGTITIPIVVKNRQKSEGNEESDKNKESTIIENERNGWDFYYEVNENNYVKATLNEDFIIPHNRKIQIVGADFKQKKSTFIIGMRKKIFNIDDNGIIEGITKEDFPLYYSFNEAIINASYLFKDVKCFKTIDLSKMDSSKLVDASNMFENSNFEEIYFVKENKSYEKNSGNSSQEISDKYVEEDNSENSTHEVSDNNLEEDNSDNTTNDVSDNYVEEYDTENSTHEKSDNKVEEDNSDNSTYEVSDNYVEEYNKENENRKEYFDTKNIKSVSEIFLNCTNLKKIRFPPSFNVGKKAKGMFKGCYNLEEVNTKLISSTEIEEMESMFEDCLSLKEISFSNDFLTGEIKSLNKVFKNTNLSTLDISYLRLNSLENYSNIFEGASINGNLKIGKYYTNDRIRDNLFKEIAKVTDSNTNVFAPVDIEQVFKNIYYSETNVNISVNVTDIDYIIHFKEDKNYKMNCSNLHIGLGWDNNESNIYNLNLSLFTFDYELKLLNRFNSQQLKAYDGIISLSSDNVTGERDGDGEEITISLNLLPSEVQIFTIQLNNYTENILKMVKSAYIRLSSDTEVIGTFSLTDVGENTSLLIGSFSKSTSNVWYFRPLNKVIPGQIVTESITSIKEILHSIYFITDNRLMSDEEFIKRLIVVANGNSVYNSTYPKNSLYWNGTHWFADSYNLIKSIINGRDVYNPINGTYQQTFPIIGYKNVSELILNTTDISNNFNNLENGVPRLLYLKNIFGHVHVGIYLGKTLNLMKGDVNVIESTTSWAANAVIYSWVDKDGTRRFYKEGPLSEGKYNWTNHGSLKQWVW